VFDIKSRGEVTFRQTIYDRDNTNYRLTGAVAVEVTKDAKQVLVAAMNENAVSVFARNSQGELTFSQAIVNGSDGISKLKLPQSLKLSPNQKYLHVLCAGNASIVVFKRSQQGIYNHIQSISNSNAGVSGLAGVTDMAFTSDGNHAFVVSEKENAIVLFRVSEDGRLQLEQVFKNDGSRNVELRGSSSVFVSLKNRHLVVTSAIGDSLVVYRLKSSAESE